MTAAEQLPYESEQDDQFDPPLNEYETELLNQFETYGKNITDPDYFTLEPQDFDQLEENLAVLGHDDQGYYEIVDMGDGPRRGLPVREEIAEEAHSLIEAERHIPKPHVLEAYRKADAGEFDDETVNDLVELMRVKYAEQGEELSHADVARRFQHRATAALELIDHLEDKGMTRTEIDLDDNEPIVVEAEVDATDVDTSATEKTSVVKTEEKVNKAGWQTNGPDGDPRGGDRRGKAGGPSTADRLAAKEATKAEKAADEAKAAEQQASDAAKPDADTDGSKTATSAEAAPDAEADKPLSDTLQAELDQLFADLDEAAKRATDATETVGTVAPGHQIDPKPVEVPPHPIDERVADARAGRQAVEDELAARREANAQRAAKATATVAEAEAAANEANRNDTGDDGDVLTDTDDEGSVDAFDVDVDLDGSLTPANGEREIIEPDIKPSRVRHALGRLAAKFTRGNKQEADETETATDGENDEAKVADNTANTDNEQATPDTDVDGNEVQYGQSLKDRVGRYVRQRQLEAKGWLDNKLIVTNEEGEVITNRKNAAVIAAGILAVGSAAAFVYFSTKGHDASALQPGAGGGGGSAVPGPDSLAIPDSATAPDLAGLPSSDDVSHEYIMQAPVNGKSDTVWHAAQEYYGTTNSHDTAEAVAKIQEANQNIDLNHVQIGQHIDMPELTPGNGAGQVTAEQMNSSVTVPEKGTFSQSVLDYAGNQGVTLSTDELYKILPSLEKYNISTHNNLGDQASALNQMQVGERVYLPTDFEDFVRHQLLVIEEDAKKVN